MSFASRSPRLIALRDFPTLSFRWSWNSWILLKESGTFWVKKISDRIRISSRLFDDGYVESLLTSHLKQDGIHLYVANVCNFMEVKTDEGKEYYHLWFIVESRGANRAISFKLNVNVKVIEMGDASTLQLPFIP